jgi:predicted ATP-grasp superfamily ATP-dependent carboligase
MLSGSDHATRFLYGHRDAIPAVLRSFESSDGPHARVLDKSSLYAIAESAGVRTPRTERATTPAELEVAARRVTYPCVLKPANVHHGEVAGQKTKPVRSVAEVLEHGTSAVEAGLEMLLSELVPGPESNLEGAVTVRLADGSFPLAYGRRKLRQWPLDYGAGSLTVAEEVPETMALARKLLAACEFVGVSSLETKRHALTGEVVLIEINVRLPQSFGLGKACGVEGPWRVYAALASLPLGPQPPVRTGTKVVVPPLERRAAAARIRRSELTLRQLLQSYRGVRSVGLLNPSDPLPAVAFVIEGLRGRLARRRPGDGG